jgi:hypothetical protein
MMLMLKDNNRKWLAVTLDAKKKLIHWLTRDEDGRVWKVWTCRTPSSNKTLKYYFWLTDVSAPPPEENTEGEVWTPLESKFKFNCVLAWDLHRLVDNALHALDAEVFKKLPLQEGVSVTQAAIHPKWHLLKPSVVFPSVTATASSSNPSAPSRTPPSWIS